MGATRLTQDAEALAQRARLPLTEAAAAHGASEPVAPHHPNPLAHFALTDREVLALLAVGRSNPQIATALFISPKTAGVHVSNILAKLSVAGRVEAAALVHRLTRPQSDGAE
jgi:DNA-binding NarL/FixJ family response regulator